MMQWSKRIVLRRTFLFVLFGLSALFIVWNLRGKISEERMSDRTLDYFFSRRKIQERDGVEVRWSHAVNSRSRLTEALTGPTHMLEADIIIRGRDPREPIMAHPPDTDSDITLREWLEAVKEHEKGIKLDFKSLDAVSPSVLLLQEVLQENLSEPGRPVWVNADILSGPGGQATPLDAQSFLSAVTTLPNHTVLSLGWTTGWTAGTENPGYSWDLMHTMEGICRTLQHPVTFPVRAALMAQSVPQLTWLLQQSDRYSLTVWTSLKDEFSLQDIRLFRKQFDISRIYFDLPESQMSQLTVTEETTTESSR